MPSPLAGKQGHDEWSAWLPERSINPPELSKWSWGLQPGTEHAAVSFLCKQQMQACKSPGSSSLLGVLGPQQTGPRLAVLVVALLCLVRFLGPGISLDPRASLWGQVLSPPSFRVSISEFRKSQSLVRGPTARAPVHICLAWGPHSKLHTVVRLLGGKARRPRLGSGNRHQKCRLA